MKRFFLIPLLTLVCSVMAWGSEITVSNFADLKAQLSASGTADVVKLANDIAYPANGDVNYLLNIERSLTLDGQGYKITGWGKCNANHDAGKTYYILTPLAINFGEEASNLDVTVKNITMSTVANKTTGLHEVGLMVFDGVSKLAVESCDIRSHLVGSNNNSGIAVYGETSDALVLKIKDSFINAGNSGYGMAVLKPINADFQNTTFAGYSVMTLYAPAALMELNYRTAKAFGTKNSGTRGTTIHATNCQFDAPNMHSGTSNAYATFALEDDGISITLTNCGIDASNFGDQKQWGIMASPRTPLSRRAQDINILYEGDNSHINGNPLGIMWAEFQELRASYKEGAYKDLCTSGTGKTFFYSYEDGYDYYAHTVLPEVEKFSATGNFNITITGGTYDFDPSAYTYNGHIDTEAADYATYLAGRETSSMEPPFVQHHITIPATHEVKTITMDGVAMPLYRVVPKTTTLYNLNDNVQSQGDGQNPTTSFELSDGSAMTLNQATTKAGYVEVSNATTVTVATAQTLVINNGLDVQGTSAVTAKPGSALVIGEGGIVTESSSSIVVEANENGAASLLLDPTITVNQTPELTVKMTVPKEHAGYEMHDANQYRHWFRFAMPVQHDDAWDKDPNVGTYLYGWDYSAQNWTMVSVSDMVPFAGYTLSPDREITNETGAITYTFTGKLMGNTNCTLNLNHHGYNFFGNSYTGYISILKLVDQIMGDAKIDGTVWMWDGEKYEGIGLEYLRQYGAIEPSWKKEVAPMQTFVLRLTGDDFSSTDINYADAIWGNPRYDGAKSALNAAPARRAEVNDDAIIRMTIEANGQKESIVLIENGVYSDAYDRGYDAIKYMNENCFNTYVGVNGENYGTVATDNLDGKMLNIKTNNELAYSMTFDFVAGEEYALRDNLTGNVIAIEEGATYEFAAQPNSTVEGRFEIVAVAKMPTAIENTEVKTNVKGIYTLTGQYMGENFEALPAGVYVVNGVKIVK